MLFTNNIQLTSYVVKISKWLQKKFKMAADRDQLHNV